MMNTESSGSVGAIRLLRRYGHAHRRWLVRGMLATIAVVALRLALPWPLKWAVELVMTNPAAGSILVSDWASQVIRIAGAFAGMAALLGYAEFKQHIALKQYAAATVHSLREDALRAVALRSALFADDGPDLISRIVSDTARIKAEVSGILLHGSQNGALYVGICVVFLVISPILGLFFFLGGAMAIAIGLYTQKRVTPVSLKQRRKEGVYAAVVQSAVEQGYLDDDSSVINNDSEERDVHTTTLIARAAWAIHVSLALTTAAALLVAFRQIRLGMLTPGELFLFMAYVLTVQRRMVQFGRQTARAGKTIAGLGRLGELVQLGSVEDQPTLTPLHDRIEMRELLMRPVQESVRGRALRKVTFSVRKGEKVAVIGRTGAGKSALLRAMSGRARPDGQIIWDGTVVTPEQLFEYAELRFLPQVSVFRRQSLGALLGVSSPDDIDRLLEKALGLKRIIRKAAKGLDTKFSSSMLTVRESRGIILYNILTDAQSSVWILDASTEGLSRKKSRRILEAIIEYAGDRLLVLSLPFATGLTLFDRVLALNKGQLVFDGSPSEWNAQKEE